MNSRICAIIFDSDETHGYKNLSTKYYLGDVDQSFNIKVYRNTRNVLEKINNNLGVDCIITVGDNLDYNELNCLPIEFRKKWVHYDQYDEGWITNGIIATFSQNINRNLGEDKTFSIFTCAYNTPKKFVDRLYKSLLNQTYGNWNWWIIDDSSKNKVCFFSEIKDPRVHIIKNVTNHGNIGFNKHVIASIADGDYLVEVDHDDELTHDCLEKLKKAFDKYNDCDFVYSYALEEVGGHSVNYGDYFALGLGKYETHTVNGVEYYIPISADINALSIRHIVGAPNHVRCWKRDFYHKIGGHNIELSVLDDLDILIRTFLYGKMCKIPKVLYIQHEGEDNGDRRNGSTTQSKRFDEIQRLGVILKEKYDLDIHNRVLELCGNDPYWENEGYSNIWSGPKDNTINFNYTYDEDE